jgi:hypothetical protein
METDLRLMHDPLIRGHAAGLAACALALGLATTILVLAPFFA